ncbi:MAG: ATP synthase F1 subunit delta [Eggerthellaceae bacterium]|jgi:F-type H+-transporting ATPase subunit delta
MPTNRLVLKEKAVVYAKALFDAANEEGGEESVLEVRRQAQEIIAAMRESVALAGALKDKTYTAEQRASVVRNVFPDCNPALVEVLVVMAERTDIDLLPRVWDRYEDLLASEMNLCVVEVTTVVPLDDHLRELIKEKAKRELGMNVVLSERIDESILAGIIMSARGERIDGSVFSQLENARHALKQTADGGEK